MRLLYQQCCPTAMARLQKDEIRGRMYQYFLSRSHADARTIRATTSISDVRVPPFQSRRLSCAGMLVQAGFTLEENPVLSVYLDEPSGRVADNKKQYFASHAGLALVAHKGPSYVCQAVGSRRASAQTASPVPSSAPEEVEIRQDVLEAVGVIVSSKQPDAGTFLTLAMAKHLIKRWARRSS